MKIRTIEERLSALEQRAGVEGAGVAKVSDTDAKSLAVNEWVRFVEDVAERLAMNGDFLGEGAVLPHIEDEEFDNYDAFVEAHKEKVKNQLK